MGNGPFGSGARKTKRPRPAAADRAVDGALRHVMLERALDLGAVGVLIDAQRVLDVDPLDDEHAVLVFDLAASLSREPARARRNLTRLQRASERPRESPARRRDDVVERRRVLGLAAAIDAVVVCHLVVDSEPDRLVAPRDERTPERAAQALDPRPARVDHLAR